MIIPSEIGDTEGRSLASHLLLDKANETKKETILFHQDEGCSALSDQESASPSSARSNIHSSLELIVR